MKYVSCCKVFFAIVLVTVSAGCAQMKAIGDKIENMQAESRLKSYSAVQDRFLVDSLYEISKDGKTHNIIPSLGSEGYRLTELSPNALIGKKNMFSTNNMSQMASAMNSYSYDSESDSLSKAYIEMALKRGNTVKVFKTAMTKKVNSMFKQPFTHMEKSAEWYDRDVTLIEFDNTSRPVSILLRGHQAQTSLGVSSYLYSSILFGSSNMRYFENKVPNSFFTDMLLREIK